MVALLVAVLAMLAGTCATYGLDRASPVYARFATGCILGMTTLAFTAFIASLAVGLGAIALVVAMVITWLPAAWVLRRPHIRVAVRADAAATVQSMVDAVRHPNGRSVVTAAYGVAIAVGVWLVADHAFFESPDGLFIGNVNNLGDLPYHVQISASFAYGDNYPPQNPVFSGSGFSYHYIADFLASVFVAAGANLVQAMLLLNAFLLASLLAVVHRWARMLTGSAIAARLAPLLFAFSGGLGFVLLLDQARKDGQGIVAAFNTGDRYTIEPDGLYRFGNTITTLVIPQRGLLLGMGIAVVVFTMLWRQVAERAPELERPGDATASTGGLPARLGLVGGWRMVVAGVLTGILPIVHAHTFAVVLGTAFFLGLVFKQWQDGRWRAWAAYVVTTLVIAAPILLWTARGSQASLSAFFGLELGWDRGENDPIWFWLTNTGVFIPLLVAAFAWRREARLPRRLLLYTLPFLAWFVLPNFFRLAPWLWDNIKVFTYWWLGSVPVVALLLARLWERQRAAKAAAVLLAVVLMTAGALDFVRAAVGATFQETDRDGAAFAERIREVTPPTAVILTEPTYNSPVFLTGRQWFMGYPGWLFANGLPYADREAQVHAIYTGDPSADELLAANGIDYIVEGPQERSDTDHPPNDGYLSKFPVIATVGEYRLLEVPK